MIEADTTINKDGRIGKRAANFLDLTGKVFGRLEVKSHEKRNGRVHWVCVCVCGNRVSVNSSSLVRGLSASCGCLGDERRSESHTTHGAWVGGKESGTHRSWRNMMERCYRPTNIKYPIYGGSGIIVEQRWHSFPNFLEDMGERPDKMTLDRKKTDGNYGPRNCRWATQKTQQNNRSNNRLLTFKGHTRTVAQWAEFTGIPPATIYARLSRMSTDRALTQPLRVIKRRAL